MNDLSEAKLIVQKWEESERGWGTRPDGYSIHRTEADRAAYVKAYWDSMPDEAPDEYSRPCGTPYEVAATKDMLLALGTKKGVMFTSNDYPGDGGKDGWKNG